MRFKICCISSIAEASLAIDHGASAIGLVSAMPSGPGVIDDERITGIAAWARNRSRVFLLTSLSSPGEIAAQVEAAGVDTVQLVDSLGPGSLIALRAMAPRVRIVQVIHVLGSEAVGEALEVAPLVDELLLDSGNPGASVKELGGTGRTHDWQLSRRIVDEAGVPVWLAGGLNPDNVAAAIDAVGPYGVDVCSGLRDSGALSPARLERFVHSLRA